MYDNQGVSLSVEFGVLSVEDHCSMGSELLPFLTMVNKIDSKVILIIYLGDRKNNRTEDSARIMGFGFVKGGTTSNALQPLNGTLRNRREQKYVVNSVLSDSVRRSRHGFLSLLDSFSQTGICCRSI